MFSDLVVLKNHITLNTKMNDCNCTIVFNCIFDWVNEPYQEKYVCCFVSHKV